MGAGCDVLHVILPFRAAIAEAKEAKRVEARA